MTPTAGAAMTTPIGDPRPAGQPGPAGDQRPAGEPEPAGDPRQAGESTTSEDGPPNTSAPKAEWEAYAQGHGYDPSEGSTKAELIDRYGDAS